MGNVDIKRINTRFKTIVDHFISGPFILFMNMFSISYALRQSVSKPTLYVLKVVEVIAISNKNCIWGTKLHLNYIFK
ncbi:MAG: hypothetical protein CMF32_12295 [Leeuwenhoekiella sp.]|nr:hypothetical protein [Leeuwenhoekiella sp.]